MERSKLSCKLQLLESEVADTKSQEARWAREAQEVGHFDAARSISTEQEKAQLLKGKAMKSNEELHVAMTFEERKEDLEAS